MIGNHDECMFVYQVFVGDILRDQVRWRAFNDIEHCGNTNGARPVIVHMRQLVGQRLDI